MNGRPQASGASVEALRRIFDASFAAPVAARAEDAEPFLALRVGGDAYAVALAEMTGFSAARRVVPVGARIPELLGLAGIRGAVVPVYGLAALLGYSAPDGPPRWFILCGTAEPVVLAFAHLDGYLELSGDDVRGAREGGAERGRTRAVIRAGGELRTVLAVPALIAVIQERVSSA